MIRATYELDPPEAVEALVTVTSTGIADDPGGVRPTVERGDGRVTLSYPEANWGRDVTLLVSALLAGEWAELAALERCRLVGVEWPDGTFPGPAFEPPAGVLVGAIIKPSLGLSPHEAAKVAGALAEGGADLIKDDELLGDTAWSPLEERVRAVVAAIPESVAYAANVTGTADGLLRRAQWAVELGAGAVMVNVFAQGLDSLRLLRSAELGVPLFAHRVGVALWQRGALGVAPPVLAELTRLCGSDYVLVSSFTGKMADSPEEVRGEIDACRRPLGVRRSVAVLGGGVSPENAAAQVTAAGVRDGLMVLLGSGAYTSPGGPAEAVRATVAAGPRMTDPIPPTIELLEGHVRLIDQRRLPEELVLLDCHTVDELCVAIRTLAVRGAPALGAAGAMGVALASLTGEPLADAARRLTATRPTAVNLAWGVERALGAADPVAEAMAIAVEDVECNRRIGANGAPLLPPGARVLTHCNTGSLATVGYGTALGVIRAAHEQGREPSVWVGETRPVLQGARLTAWELTRLDIPYRLVVDSLAGALMAAGEVDAVIVGADRIAANGDVANKVGTYALAVLAHHHELPFYVAAPESTIDPATPTGADIPVEQRAAEEVAELAGHRIAPAGAKIDNRAFDVTPAGLVTAYVTELGVARSAAELAAK